MESEASCEKVFVAIGADWYDGFSTLKWALRKWSNHDISIVILHVPNTICKDYVYTPIGKLPTSSVNEEKIKVLEKIEEANRDKILSQYMASCGKVKAEVMEIEKNDEQPLHKQILEIISTFRITKLVVSLGFMKHSSWKSRGSINGVFDMVRQKPDFCEMFVICGGRLIFLRGEDDERFIEDDRGFVLAKLKEKNYSIRNWLGKIFPENGVIYSNNPPDSPSSPRSHDSTQQWEKIDQSIEHYANQLLSSHRDEGEFNEANAMLKEYSTELCVSENMNSTQDTEERIRDLKTRIQNARDMIEFNRNQVNAAKERLEKAKWAISICNTRVKELEESQNEEIAKTMELNKEIESRREEMYELECEVEQKRSKLNSIFELQNELSTKLHMSSSGKARAEAQLEKAVQTRTVMIQEIEKLRKQRDVLRRRIEFCREKDAIGKVTKSIGLGFDFREFSAAEIKEATDNFSEHLRMRSMGRLTNVYKGRVNHTTVAVKMYNLANTEFPEALATKVKLLSQIRHPNILATIGYCTELNCIVYEYAQNGTVSEALFSTRQGGKRKNPTLNWHARIRIASEICSALGFLHKAKPRPIVHGNLKPSEILLDQNNVVKINGSRDPWSHHALGIKLDVRAFGKLVVQLLTSESSVDAMDNVGLDQSVGPWPKDLAMELCVIARRCLSDEGMVKMPTRAMDDVRKRADLAAGDDERSVSIAEESAQLADLSNVPSAFLCPIYQDVMRNPHLAADGFSYELEAINEWFKTGHDTSPVTNLRLTNKLLTPNHTLRSAIQDWQNKESESDS